MKKIILFSLLIIISQICRAQVPTWLWAISANGTEPYEYMSGVTIDTSANKVFIGGRAGGSNNFGGIPFTSGSAENPFMAEFNENGDAIWISDTIYSDSYDYPYGYFRDKNDNTYSVGVVNSFQNTWVNKYNNAGHMNWSTYAGNYNLFMHGIAVDGKGYIYISGYMNPGSVTLGSITINYPGSYSAVVIAKLDPSGNFVWAKCFYGSGSGDGVCTGRGLTIDSHANIYIAGGYLGSPVFGSFTAPLSTGISNLFVAKIDSAGNVLNLITGIGGGYNTNDCCASAPITIDSCENVYVGGYFGGTAQFGDFVLHAYGAQDAYIAKLDHDGTWDWAQNFGGNGTDGAGGITLDKYTDVYAFCSYQGGAAQIEGSNITGGDLAVVKLDNGRGYVDWMQSAGNTDGDDQAGPIAVDNKGYIYVAGDFTNTVTFGSTSLSGTVAFGTAFLAKLDTLNHISISPNPDSFYCAGRTYTLPYTITGTFSSGNIFTAQLSNSSGSFASPVDIGSFYSTANGTISITIPPSTPYGTHYRIRILSTLPPLITTIPTSNCIYRPVDTAYFYITIYPIPSLVIGGKNSVCPGDTTVLSTYGADHYLWNNGDTTSSITVAPTSSTTYSVILTNGPCIYNDTTTVFVNPLPVITVSPPSSVVCSGRGLSLAASGASTYEWSPANGLNATTGIAVYAGPDSTTTYTVFGTDSNGCTGKTTVTVNVAVEPSASFISAAPNLCQPQQLQFTNTSSGDSLTYLWRFGDGKTSNEINPLHTFSSTGKYEVTLVITSPRGCVDSVKADEIIGSIEGVFIPNAFTPNGEINNTFYPNITCNDYSDYIFRVYDRWGMMLFESSKPNQGWDGTYNEKTEPMDTYVYYLKMTCGTCSVFKKGNVTLIR